MLTPLNPFTDTEIEYIERRMQYSAGMQTGPIDHPMAWEPLPLEIVRFGAILGMAITEAEYAAQMEDQSDAHLLLAHVRNISGYLARTHRWPVLDDGRPQKSEAPDPVRQELRRVWRAKIDQALKRGEDLEIPDWYLE